MKAKMLIQLLAGVLLFMGCVFASSDLSDKIKDRADLRSMDLSGMNLKRFTPESIRYQHGEPQ